MNFQNCRTCWRRCQAQQHTSTCQNTRTQHQNEIDYWLYHWFVKWVKSKYKYTNSDHYSDNALFTCFKSPNNSYRNSSLSFWIFWNQPHLIYSLLSHSCRIYLSQLEIAALVQILIFWLNLSCSGLLDFWMNSMW